MKGKNIALIDSLILTGLIAMTFWKKDWGYLLIFIMFAMAIFALPPYVKFKRRKKVRVRVLES